MFRASAAAVALGAVLAACGGRSGVPDIVPLRQTASSVRDLGRRSPTAPVSVTIALRYNHQPQLDALVRAQSDPGSAAYRRYLSTEEFNAYYAPTPQQEAAVIRSLQSAGFRITQRFPNRTIVDAVAPAATVEHYFATEMHTVSQGKFGERFTSVKPATIPAAISGEVRAVSLSNLIVARPLRRPARTHLNVPPFSSPIRAMTGNVIQNPGFETGAVNDFWFQCGNVYATVSTNHPHSGFYSERSGSTNSLSGEPYGDAGVCQQVTIPPAGVLSFWVYQISDEADTSYAWQEADLLDGYGRRVLNFYYSVNNYAGWVKRRYGLGARAGQTYYLYFGVHGDGYPYTYTWQYVDDVSLASATPTPVPTTTPRPTPTPVPTPTPTPGCDGAAALTGPRSGAFGWYATGVAKAFDYPVQHGCSGTGQTVAIEIDAPVTASDVATYLSAAGVHQNGSITNVAVDGGGDPASTDYLETALDVETVAGLAPGANIRVYHFPDLSDQSIEDGYNKTVSDGVAAIVNSSFGGCESDDPSFASATNAIAEQAAAKGITFVAASGDSGSYECAGALGVSEPAGDPYFVALGAVNFTSSSTTGALTSITAGADPGNGFQSGGGTSTLFALPSYQSGVAGTAASGRNSPDLALPGVGVALYAASQGGWMTVDGTSWSSPEFVALLAEAAQRQGVHFGFVNPTLYTIFKNSHYTDYTDVTSGTNGAYNAVAGYDRVTGIGAPKGWALANAL